MKLLAGLLPPDAGEIIVGGSAKRFRSRRDAMRHGIGFIQQEFSLVASLTCAENLLLANPHRSGWVDRRAAAVEIRRVASRFDLEIDPTRRVRDLSMGERQQLEIVIALALRSEVLLLDEPTSSTGQAGFAFLQAATKSLKDDGVGVVYVSHKLPEVLELCDWITVMRQGRKVWGGPADAASETELANHMVGEPLSTPSSRRAAKPGEAVLQISAASTGDNDGRPLRDVTLEVRRGEVVGVAGVVGNGQRELARLAVGLVRPIEGSVMSRVGTPGAGYVAEDRARDGLALGLPLTDNVIVHRHRRPPIVRRGRLQRSEIREFTLRVLERVGLERSLLDRGVTAGALSGGMQQRIVLGREIEESSDLLVLHNPARGLDVKSTSELYAWIDEFSRSGGGTLLISPDLDELIQNCDAIYVLFDGGLTGPFAARSSAIPELASRMAGVT